MFYSRLLVSVTSQAIHLHVPRSHLSKYSIFRLTPGLVGLGSERLLVHRRPDVCGGGLKVPSSTHATKSSLLLFGRC